MAIFLTLVAVSCAALLWRFWSKRQNRARLLASELSSEQRALMLRHVPLVRKLPSELRGRLEGKVLLFLDQVAFIGCNGLEVTEAMRLSIATQAALLVVNSDAWYAHLRTVLIYPGAFRSKVTEQNGYVVTEREIVRTGESWPRGPVVLSWEDTERGALDFSDGHNVVLHEFAHQLDDLSGETDGVPVLSNGQSFADWQRVFSAAYEAHVHNVMARRETVFDPYGAEKPVEFFAVAVEVFFERPKEMKREAPEVYAQLADLFRLDPASWA